ncbi:MAG TPA: NADH-quinone oxidoreductase subunit NuoG [Candidatus Eremiobacteraceae bacterium]|nr:NADH-quinone oxidoreductase subunit NuoG [Candidatus Eremiobacteraceae bacterium]
MSQEKQVRDVSVTIDGNTFAVPEGTLVVEAAKHLGTQIPVYCYHPKLEPAGLCRICLVEIEKMPKLQIACATRVADGMVVHTTSAKVAEARRGVLEFLLLNHPLDCPVCDKGGECELQDFTMSYGPGESRLTEPKLHKPKLVDLGPTIVLDEERCILCRRCTRFDDEIAQERTLIVEERGFKSLISTRNGGAYASYFSGNTTEICPVGALTSKAYRFRSRPWDLNHTDGVCTQCSVGCNYRIDTRFGRIMRTFTRENPDVDDGWICDRGRYTFNYLYAPERLRTPSVKRDGGRVDVPFVEAAALAGAKLAEAAARGRVGVIGGGRLSDEEAFALQRFAREVLGTNNIDYRTHAQAFASPSRFGAHLTDLDDASHILVFGAITQEQAPILDLRIRRAVARGRATLTYIGPYRPAFTIEASHIRSQAHALPKLLSDVSDAVRTSADQSRDGDVGSLASRLSAAKKIVAIHSGEDVASAEALERLMETLQLGGRSVGILVVGATGNARGAEAAGCVPNLGPGYAPVSGEAGMTTNEMLAAAADGRLDALFVMGANPALTVSDGALVRRALKRIPFLAVADQVMTETGSYAHIVFASASFAEKRGHTTNLEGSRQAFAAAVEPPLEVRTDAQIIGALAAATGRGSISDNPETLYGQLAAAESAARAKGDGAPLARPAQLAQDATATPIPDGAFTVVPTPHLYAGGGAAAHDPGTKPMRPAPYAEFGPADALLLAIEDNARVRLSGPSGSIEVFARVAQHVPDGCVLVLADMPEAPHNLLLDGSGSGWANVEVLAGVAEAAG